MSLTQVIKSMTERDEVVGALHRAFLLVGGCSDDHNDCSADAKRSNAESPRSECVVAHPEVTEPLNESGPVREPKTNVDRSRGSASRAVREETPGLKGPAPR